MLLTLSLAMGADHSEAELAGECAAGDVAACERLAGAAQLTWAAGAVADSAASGRRWDGQAEESWMLDEATWALRQACTGGDGLACLSAGLGLPGCETGNWASCHRAARRAGAPDLSWATSSWFPFVEKAGFFDNGAPWFVAGDTLLLGARALPVQILSADVRPTVLALSASGHEFRVLRDDSSSGFSPSGLGPLDAGRQWAIAESHGRRWVERDVLPPEGYVWDGGAVLLPADRLLAMVTRGRETLALDVGDGTRARLISAVERLLGTRTLGRWAVAGEWLVVVGEGYGDARFTVLRVRLDDPLAPGETISVSSYDPPEVRAAADGAAFLKVNGELQRWDPGTAGAVPLVTETGDAGGVMLARDESLVQVGDPVLWFDPDGHAESGFRVDDMLASTRGAIWTSDMSSTGAGVLIQWGSLPPAPRWATRLAGLSPSAAPDADTWGEVYGRINPVAAGARLQLLQGPRHLDAVPDASGAFRFPDVPLGDYVLVASGKGTAAAWQDITLSPDNRSIEVTSTLAPSHTCTFPVVDALGKPVAGAPIWASNPATPSPPPYSRSPEGRYRRGRGDAPSPHSEAFGGFTDPAGMASVALPSLEGHVRVTFEGMQGVAELDGSCPDRVQLSTFTELALRVRWPDGRPAYPARVTIGEKGQRHAETDSRGSVHLQGLSLPYGEQVGVEVAGLSKGTGAARIMLDETWLAAGEHEVTAAQAQLRVPREAGTVRVIPKLEDGTPGWQSWDLEKPEGKDLLTAADIGEASPFLVWHGIDWAMASTWTVSADGVFAPDWHPIATQTVRLIGSDGQPVRGAAVAVRFGEQLFPIELATNGDGAVVVPIDPGEGQALRWTIEAPGEPDAKIPGLRVVDARASVIDVGAVPEGEALLDAYVGTWQPVATPRPGAPAGVWTIERRAGGLTVWRDREPMRWAGIIGGTLWVDPDVPTPTGDNNLLLAGEDHLLLTTTAATLQLYERVVAQ